jgi:hypothetical protein
VTELNRDEQQVAAFLADLADDPDAPPSQVTVQSVLAAARAQAGNRDPAYTVPLADAAAGDVDEPADGVPTVRAPDAPPKGGDVHGGDVHGGDVHGGDQDGRSGGTVLDGRSRFQGRRRTVIVGLLAAAAVVAVGAVVVPLVIRSQDSVTSASSATAAETAPSGPGSPEVAPSAQDAAGGAGATSAASGHSASRAAPVPAASVPATSTAADQHLPLASADGATSAAAPVVPPGVEPFSACSWPPLTAGEVTALTRALPTGRFGAQRTLTGGCTAHPVAGAQFAGKAGAPVIVRISRAEVGACARGTSEVSATEAGSRCVPKGAGQYLVTDPSGAPIAYAYGNGLEVAVGPDLSPTGALPRSPHTPKISLPPELLVGAPAAVLGAAR